MRADYTKAISLNFCCPICKEPLDHNKERYTCPQCSRVFPLICGIPDFCIFDDHYMSYEDDYKIGMFLLDSFQRVDFKMLMKLYFEEIRNFSERETEHKIARAAALVDKGIESLREIDLVAAVKNHQIGLNAVLEIGCGTGGFLVAGKRKFDHVIGLDISLTELILAKKRIGALGLQLPLICGCAEYLPFSTSVFDLIFAEDVLEHVRDQESILKECNRVLKDNGVLFVATPNRYSITPEPHVHVWGVGYLPRRWMNKYVKLIKKKPYEFKKLVSFFDLKRMLRKCNFEDNIVLLPSVSKEELHSFSTLRKALVVIYELAKRIPLLRSIFYLIGPFFHVICFVQETNTEKHSIYD